MKKTVFIVITALIAFFLMLFLIFGKSGMLKNIKIKTTEQVEEERREFAFENSPFYEKYYKSDKLIVLNIWATWCKPCIEEMPALNRLKNHFSDNKDIIFLSLSTDEDSIKINSFLDSDKFNFEDISIENFPYRKYILNHLKGKKTKSDPAFYIRIESSEIPITYVIKDQKINYSHTGKIDSAKLYNQINSLLK